MSDSTPSGQVRDLDRMNLRVSIETLAAIDAARSDRPGNISRNTWITEAIKEKLVRDREIAVPAAKSDRSRHG